MSDETLNVVVDVPKGAFVKRHEDGSVDFVSPVPCPFNYGHLPGTLAGDNDAIDAVILGPRLSAGTALNATVQGRIRFIDAGEDDPKWIFATRPLSQWQRFQVTAFFFIYGTTKRILNRMRGKPGATRYVGWI